LQPPRQRRLSTARLSLLGCLALAALSAACAPPPPPPVHDGPVVLITLGSLRADAVGYLAGGDLTPNLDVLAAEADWAGRAVAPSSWVVPALGSLLTGLSPWQHQAVDVGRVRLAPELVTVAESLAARGYRGTAYVGGLWMRNERSWHQGFTEVRAPHDEARAAGHLASLGDPGAERRQFLWIHLRQPSPPLQRHDELRRQMPRLSDAFLDALPSRVDVGELARYADPSTPVPYDRRRVFVNLYRYNVASADRALGKLLAALRASGQWDDTLLVVTALHGEELGDYGSTGSGHSLGRVLLEVPLVVHLPRSLWGAAERHVAEPLTRRVALARVAPTLVAAVGGEAVPAASPSLFVNDPGGILSELYLGNGVNQFSWLEEAAASEEVGGETWQLIRRASFAAPEGDYYAARLAGYGIPATGLQEAPEAILGRLAAAFESAPPFTGRRAGGAQLSLLRWKSGGGVEAVDDAARTQAMEQRLRRGWLTVQGCERSPEAESAYRRRQRAAELPERDAAGH